MISYLRSYNMYSLFKSDMINKIIHIARLREGEIDWI